MSQDATKQHVLTLCLKHSAKKMLSFGFAPNVMDCCTFMAAQNKQTRVNERLDSVTLDT